MNKVVIVGGGLAGMFAAIALAERQIPVTLYESTDRLGGKAGSNLVNGRYEDHGYHVFPDWYRNIWTLMDKLGVRDNFKPVTDFHELERPTQDKPLQLDNEVEEKFKFKHFHNVASHNLKTFYNNLTSGALHVSDMFLFYYLALDLISQSDNPPTTLDEMSVAGFIQSRRHASKEATNEIHEMLLKACSSPSYTLSSLTLQKMVQYWARYPEPMFYITRESLQESFIKPLESYMRKLGCKIHFHYALTGIQANGNRVSCLELVNTKTNAVVHHEVDQFVLALQPKDIWQILESDEDLLKIAPSLFDLFYLDAEPMAALHIPLINRPKEILSDHIGLVESKFELSFIDVSQFRTGYKQPVLNIVASDFTRLKNLSENPQNRDDLIDIIIGELREYFPEALAKTNIDYPNIYFEPHIKEPLFMNYVGSWRYRPDPNKSVKELFNLFLAGDYCKTDINLATMEGAAESGLRAAAALGKAIGLAEPIERAEIKFYPRLACQILKIVAMPFAEFALQWSRWIHRKEKHDD